MAPQLSGKYSNNPQRRKHPVSEGRQTNKVGVQDLVQNFILSLPLDNQRRIGFRNERPSMGWLDRFVHRHGLEYKPVRVIEPQRIEAVFPEKVARHIALLGALMKRFNINSPCQVFNLDESGFSVSKSLGRSLRKGVGNRDDMLIQKAVRVKGAGDRVTVMPVISADGRAWKPIVVFWGKNAHYRFVNGSLQTLHNFLPPCYLYQRPVPGVDSAIFYNWASKFVKETSHIKFGGRYLLLVLDGYAGHIQFKTLNFFKENRVIVVALPANSSHILQPLDVTVFGPYKSYLQREFHRVAREKLVLDAFDVGYCVAIALPEALTMRNICDGFARTGIWVSSENGPSHEPLSNIISLSGDHGNVTGMEFCLESLVSAFSMRWRSLVSEAEVDESGTVKVSTEYGAHLTADTILNALQARSAPSRNYENAGDLRRLIELAPRRDRMMKVLESTRKDRRRKAAQRAAFSRAAVALVQMAEEEVDEDM